MADPGDRPLAAAPWLTAAPTRLILDALEAGGTPARLVGGCVRDGLVDPERDVADLDLATPLPPHEAMRRLREAGVAVIPTGIEHGTVTALLPPRRYEITTLRRDVSTDGRRATVAFTDDFDEDAARRDFTVNAMRCDRDGRVNDPFGGRADLAAGRIRFVGDPAQRIEEDHLRILRFFRFFAALGRPPADGEALAACRAMRAGIDLLSGERLQQELRKLLPAPAAPEALALMNGCGVAGHLFPVAIEPAALAAVARADPDADWLLRLAALLRHAGAGADALRALVSRLRLSGRDADRLALLCSAPLPDPAAGGAAHRAAAWRRGVKPYRDLLVLAEAAGRGDSGPHRRLLATWTPPDFPLSGNDLVAAGMTPGPALGRRLEALRGAWLDSDFSLDREALLALPPSP